MCPTEGSEARGRFHRCAVSRQPRPQGSSQLVRVGILPLTVWEGSYRFRLKGYLTESFGTYGDFVGDPLFNPHLCVIDHLSDRLPHDAKHVLHTNQNSYSKGVVNHGALKKLVGEGRLTSDGPAWLRDHRQLQSALLPQRVKEVDC
jgi:hypothetical protein